MRALGTHTITKRGCEYCGDVLYNMGNHTAQCPHDKCPYRALDAVENWKQYDVPASKRSARMVRELGMERKKYKRRERAE